VAVHVPGIGLCGMSQGLGYVECPRDWARWNVGQVRMSYVGAEEYMAAYDRRDWATW
jgi:hypothetical protein